MGTANRSQTSPYIQYSVTADFQYSTVDFTNPDAAEWFAQVGRRGGEEGDGEEGSARAAGGPKGRGEG